MSEFNTQNDALQAQYQRLKAAFVERGTSLNAWCLENGTHIQNVRDAFFGRWKGPRAADLVAKVSKACEGSIE